MNEIKIPKSFNLFAQEINVELNPILSMKDDIWGSAQYRFNKILLQSNENGYNRKPEQLEQTYLHEVVHHILYAMNEKDLQSNEKFVDVFASCLHQILKTSNYEGVI